MINLLPQKEKQILGLEETKRLVITLGNVVLISLFCLILILFSLKTYLRGQVESERIVLSEVEREFKQSDIQNLQEKINLTNLIFSKLNSFYQQRFYFTEIIEKISATLPPETYLTNLSINPLFGRGVDCSLSGFAQTREILFEFKKNLESQEYFKEIYFPPTNWVKPTDIKFDVTFKIIK